MLLLELDREIKRSEFIVDARNPHGCFSLSELSSMLNLPRSAVESGRAGTIFGVNVLESSPAPTLQVQDGVGNPIFEVRTSPIGIGTDLIMTSTMGNRFRVWIDDSSGQPILRSDRVYQ